MSDLESGEDGQMVIVKKRLIWWKPTKTAAFESLDDFQNIEKKREEWPHRLFAPESKNI